MNAARPPARKNAPEPDPQPDTFERYVPGVAYALHERIEEERARRGLGTRALARAAHVSPTTLNNLPWVRNPPQIGTVTALADVLGIPRGEALILAGLARPRFADASKEARDAILRIPTYSDEQRRSLLAVIAAFDAQSGTTERDATG